MLAVAWRCVLILAFTASSIVASANELPLKFDPKRDAAKDVATAVQLAKSQGKRVLVDVGGEWCGWCHIMDRFFAANEEARALRDAAKDVATAVQLAKSQGKRVLVDVGGEWCGWCHIMDRFFAANEEARELRDGHYVWVKINWSKENTNEATLSRWPKISGYPHLFVLDADGTLLHSQDTSLLEEGKGYDKAKFVAFLAKWAPSADAPPRLR